MRFRWNLLRKKATRSRKEREPLDEHQPEPKEQLDFSAMKSYRTEKTCIRKNKDSKIDNWDGCRFVRLECGNF